MYYYKFLKFDAEKEAALRETKSFFDHCKLINVKTLFKLWVLFI